MTEEMPPPPTATSPLPASSWVAPLLEGWANQIAARFHAPVWLVGSALEQAEPRDIDIRVVLPDAAFQRRYGCSWIETESIGHDVSSPEVVRYWRDVAKLGEWASIHHGQGSLNIDFQVQTDHPPRARAWEGKPRIRLDKLGDLTPTPAVPTVESIRAALATTEDSKRELAAALIWRENASPTDVVTDMLAAIRRRAGLE